MTKDMKPGKETDRWVDMRQAETLMLERSAEKHLGKGYNIKTMLYAFKISVRRVLDDRPGFASLSEVVGEAWVSEVDRKVHVCADDSPEFPERRSMEFTGDTFAEAWDKMARRRDAFVSARRL